MIAWYIKIPLGTRATEGCVEIELHALWRTRRLIAESLHQFCTTLQPQTGEMPTRTSDFELHLGGAMGPLPPYDAFRRDDTTPSLEQRKRLP